MRGDQERIANRIQPLAGRSRERAVLAEALADARSGRARCVVVRGPGGVGKSRLLSEVTRHEHARTCTVLHVSCPDVTSPLRYDAVRALFEPLGLGADDVSDSAVRVLFPGRRAGAPHGNDHETLSGLRSLAANLMASAPLVLVVDDAHRCDEGSLRWLDFLLRRAADLPLLILLGHRCDDVDDTVRRALSRIVGQRASSVIQLAPLTRDEVGDIVATVFSAPPDSSFVDACARASGGNPSLLHRLLDDVRNAGIGPDAAGVLSVEAAEKGVLAASVLNRLAGQPRRVFDVAAALALLGPGAGAESVAALAAATRWQVGEALDVLRGCDIVAESGMDFAHASIRDAVLDAVPVSEADRLRAARILNDAGRPAVEVAQHLLALTELNQQWMAGVLRDAAALSEQRGELEIAVRYLRRVLDVETSGPQRIRVRGDLGRVLAQLDPYAALPIMRELLDRVADPDAYVSFVLNFAMTAVTAQRHPEAVRVLAEVLAMLATKDRGNASPAHRELCLSLESMLMIVGSAEKSTFSVVRDRIERRPLPAGSTPAERRTLAAIAFVHSLRCEPSAQVVAHARTALSFQTSDADPWSERCALFALHLADVTDDLLPAAQRSLDLVESMGASWDYSYSLSCYARVLLHFGDVREAAEQAQTAAKICAQTRGADSTSAQFTAWASALAELGQVEQADEVLDRIDREWFEEATLEWHYFLHTRARVRWIRGDRTAALELLLRCGRSMTDAGILNPVFAPWRTDAAWLLVGLGRRAEAVELVEQDAEAVHRWGTARAIGRHLMARGAVAENPSRAVDSLTEAVQVLSGSPAWLDEARAHHRLGEFLLRTDDTRGARKHLRRCIDLATLCGSRPIAESARALVVTAGGRVGQPLRSPVDLLTGSELRVATMAAAGASNRAIAEALFVTLRTVEAHLTNAYRKLRVSKRAELAAVLGGARTRLQHDEDEDEATFAGRP
ncbi:AAA family ATPase [Saccharopolyspora dendranthemae]|uniref:Regulatory LuxR family protein n=1 Tax=Saccharopolyspora dendranthemae TaxID=1181886 RepID=A0A561U3F5_9PSEU|nr:LuxR family transcriptional regulator [Saccharopolyspora dendranthemae]TWF93895.1 regulatory LuxR family protein [Saccharopolyspora dendranthemae]